MTRQSKLKFGVFLPMLAALLLVLALACGSSATSTTAAPAAQVPAVTDVPEVAQVAEAEVAEVAMVEGGPKYGWYADRRDGGRPRDAGPASHDGRG